VTIIAIAMTIEILTEKSPLSFWPYRAFSPRFSESSCKYKMILSMTVRGEGEKLLMDTIHSLLSFSVLEGPLKLT
jgi:hypothetical protein